VELELPRNVIKILISVDYFGTIPNLAALIDTGLIRYVDFQQTNNLCSLVHMSVHSSTSHAEVFSVRTFFKAGDLSNRPIDRR
jgi:hypothetical protein